MFDKLTIEDHVNESDAYDAAKNFAEWEDRIEAMERDFVLEDWEAKRICFHCGDRLDNCECSENSDHQGLTNRKVMV